MTQVGTPTHPLRVAIIGSGPAAFYAADFLFKRSDLAVVVDMFDCLPIPFGLVRFGVSPDHYRIKSVTRVFDEIANRPTFAFFGNVELGKHIQVSDLRQHYHQIVYATGAQSDRHMGIPGEDLLGSHFATKFVAWYNGHPYCHDLKFDLSVERAAVIGVGNVAIDVARMLCHSPEDLAATDMADYAIAAFAQSRVKDVYLIGRRGPAQAAFTNPEIKEVLEMPSADVILSPDEVALDPLSRDQLASNQDRALARKVQMLQEHAQIAPAGRPHSLHIRFLMSPVEVQGDAQGRVTRLKLVRNELVLGADGSLRPQATDRFEELEVGLVFRSVGYRGVPLPGVPFDDRRGVIPNDSGRVVDPEARQPVVGEYASGWIKRGPSGIIGTNKADSAETVGCMLEDVAKGSHLAPTKVTESSMAALVRERQPDFLTYDDWRRLDALEIAAGAAQGRPRVKFTTVEEMLGALGRR